MGRKQKLKQERRMEEVSQMNERKKKRNKTIKILLFLVLIAWAGSQVAIAMKSKKEEKNPIAVIETDKGNIKMELYKNDAPKTVENFMKLANEKFYDGITFHRVEPGFVIQAGDPVSKGVHGKDYVFSGEENPDKLPVVGMGGPGYKFEDEINPWSLGLSDSTVKANEAKGFTYDKNLKSHKIEVGTLAMANSGANTNGSQFFIVTEKPQPQLDGMYTAFGKVIEGMDVAAKIERGDVMRKVYILK